MKQEKTPTFFQKPKTAIAWWAGGLALLSILMMAANTLGLNPLTETTPVPVWIYDALMFLSFFVSIILGLIAITVKRDRSWVAWLFMVPILSYIATIGYLLNEQWKFAHPALETAPTPDPSLVRAPIIFDDDGSPDGTSALLYLLSDPRADVKAVSVSYGEAHPQIYIHYLGWLMERFGYGDVPLGAGQDAPIKGANRFPDFVREASNGFWGFTGANSEKRYPVENSPAMMVRVVRESQEPVTIFVSGSLTNLALALRMDPKISGNIARVYIMGGAVNVSGNINDLLPETDNQLAEWNIFVDPVAASEVISSGLSLYLVPLDATNQVRLSRQDLMQWRKGGSIPNMAADFYEPQFGSSNTDEVAMWDLVTAAIMMSPEYCDFTAMRLEVVTDAGDSQGQTRVEPGDANVMVCLQPDATGIKEALSEVFSKRK